MTVRFEVFGGARVVDSNGPIALPRQVTTLLGALLADAGRPVSVERIIDRIWGEAPPATAPKIVHIGIGKLRRALAQINAEAGEDSAAGALKTVTDGYLLDAVAVDLEEWRNAAADAERLGINDAASAFDAATSACRLWRGRPWGSQADDGWLQTSVRALEARQREIEELRSDLVLRLGLSSSTIVDFESAAECEPLRERRWAQLMLALYRAGRQADALRTYQRAREVLQRELGIEPGPELRRLELSILQQDADLEHAAPRPDDVRSPTSFVGRTDELAHLARALDRERLVSVVGIGGIGKTRLVQEFVHRYWSATRVQSVSIAGVEHVARLDAHLATQLGVFLDSADTLVSVLAAALGRAGSLLVIDGAEPFPEAIGALALALLERCRGLRIVVTSRVPLGVGVERTVHLTSLPIAATDAPISGSDLALMIDRAGYDPAALDESSMRQLRAACAGAAGVPLLVELAARAFQLGAPPPPVSQTKDAVAASIAHSLAAVDEVAERVLRRGSVLPGGLSERVAASLAGLDAVAAQRSLRQLAWLHLVDASPARSSLRYRSLDPIRSTLQSEMSIDTRNAAYAGAATAMQEVVDRLWPDRLRPVSLDALDDVHEEHDNLRFVLDDRLTADPSRALDLAIAASEYWSIRGHIPEGRHWIAEAVAAARPVGPRRWAAELAYARSTRTFAEVARRRDALEQACHESRHDADHTVLFGGLLMFTAIARGWSGDRVGAANAMAEASALEAASDSPWVRAHLDHLRALDLALGGDFPLARQRQRDFAVRMLELDDPISAATGYYLAAALGDMAGATDVLPDIIRSRELATKVRDVSLLCRLLLIEARLQARAGDDRSRDSLAIAIEQLEREGGIRAATVARRDLGLMALAGGRIEEAAAALLRSARTLLQLDASAARAALAGLAQIAQRRGNPELASRLATRARRQLEGEPPSMLEDDARVAELLAGIAPAAEELRGDEDLLDWFDSQERMR